MSMNRKSGVLAHITSLPARFGIGDIGQAALDFINFLHNSGQSCWQFLPINPVCEAFDYSPYMSLSAFAGCPLLISPREMVKMGFLDENEIDISFIINEYRVQFSEVACFKEKIFHLAFTKFKKSNIAMEFDNFCAQEKKWLDDYALFMSLRQEFNNLPWFKWPQPLAKRRRKSLALWRTKLSDEILLHKFIQYVFHEQWMKLRSYAKAKDIRLIGDIPIYVGYDSADVWAHQDCFMLKKMMPTHVAGVPPDYFSETGQRWGNPLYQWQKNKKHNKNLYEWWRQRLAKIGALVDIVRIDHFRGFESFWQIPADEETAINGTWVKGPDKFFFKQMAKVTVDLEIIAEDLGIITPEVDELRRSCGFPGMKILQFAFDSDETNSYLPHNFTSTNTVVYTGTHDNDTTVGWYYDPDIAESSKNRVRRYANADGSRIHWDFIRLAYSSIAETAIIPLQDVLGFGTDCRMNRPSTKSENWRWRCASRFLNDEISRNLRTEVVFYNRLPELNNKNNELRAHSKITSHSKAQSEHLEKWSAIM